MPKETFQNPFSDFDIRWGNEQRNPADYVAEFKDGHYKTLFALKEDDLDRMIKVLQRIKGGLTKSTGDIVTGNKLGQLPIGTQILGIDQDLKGKTLIRIDERDSHWREKLSHRRWTSLDIYPLKFVITDLPNYPTVGAELKKYWNTVPAGATLESEREANFGNGCLDASTDSLLE